jgi:hypothetical protein
MQGFQTMLHLNHGRSGFCCRRHKSLCPQTRCARQHCFFDRCLPFTPPAVVVDRPCDLFCPSSNVDRHNKEDASDGNGSNLQHSRHTATCYLASERKFHGTLSSALFSNNVPDRHPPTMFFPEMSLLFSATDMQLQGHCFWMWPPIISQLHHQAHLLQGEADRQR